MSVSGVYRIGNVYTDVARRDDCRIVDCDFRRGRAAVHVNRTVNALYIALVKGKVNPAARRNVAHEQRRVLTRYGYLAHGKAARAVHSYAPINRAARFVVHHVYRSVFEDELARVHGNRFSVLLIASRAAARIQERFSVEVNRDGFAFVVKRNEILRARSRQILGDDDRFVVLGGIHRLLQRHVVTRALVVLDCRLRALDNDFSVINSALAQGD